MADTPDCHAFQAAGDAHRPPRLVLAAFADVDRAMADGRWLAMDAESTVEVEP